MTGACAAAISTGSNAFSATASPPEVSGFSNTGAVANIATGATAVSTVGATGSVTHSWAQYGTSAYTWVISSASGSMPFFTCNGVPVGAVVAATFIDTITDSTGAKARVIVYANVNNGQPYAPPNAGNPPIPPGGEIP